MDICMTIKQAKYLSLLMGLNVTSPRIIIDNLHSLLSAIIIIILFLILFYTNYPVVECEGSLRQSVLTWPGMLGGGGQK